MDSRGVKRQSQLPGNSSKNCVDRWVSCVASRHFRWEHIQKSAPAFPLLRRGGGENQGEEVGDFRRHSLGRLQSRLNPSSLKAGLSTQDFGLRFLKAPLMWSAYDC